MKLINIIGVLAALLLCPSAVAANNFKTVIIQQSDGTKVDIALSTKLSIEFTDNDMTLIDDDIYVNIPRQLIDEIYFSEEEAGIDSAVYDITSPEISAAGIYFHNLHHNTLVAIYAVNGELLQSFAASADCFIPFANIPARIFLITIDDKTYKVCAR